MSAAPHSLLAGERGVLLLALASGVAFAALAAGEPRRAAYVVAGAAAVFVVLRSLLAGLALFIVLTFPEQLPGTLGVGPTLAKPLGIVLVISWLLVIIGDREGVVPFLPRDAPVLTFAMLALLVWSLTSISWASDGGLVLQNSARLAQLVGLVFLTYSAIRRPRDLFALAAAFLLGAVITSTYALANGTLKGGRLTGGIFNPNSFAAELVAAMLLATFLLISTHRTAVRLVLIASLALFAVAFVETQSRSGVLALASAALAGIVFAGARRGRFLAVVLITCALGLGYYVTAASPQLRERISSIGTGGQASPLRQDTWQFALRSAHAHPIQGVGLGNFPVVEGRYLAATVNVMEIGKLRQTELVVHNTYLEILAELGIVGLALFGSILVMTIGRTIAALARYRREDGTRVLAAAVIAGLAGVMTSQVFNSGEYWKPPWLLLGIALAAASFLNQASVAVPSPLRRARLAGTQAA